ncbi:MAG TPA: glycosyltransferase 87 family protein [bacterium]|nr:glycosyltransferase 87 family protein [bacterium]
MTGGDPSRRAFLALLVPTVCVVLSSFLRPLTTGSIKVDENYLSGLPLVAAILLFVVSLAIFTLGYFRVVMRAPGHDLSASQTKRLAQLLIVVSFFMLPMLSNDIFSLIAYGDTALRGNDPFTDPLALQRSQFFPFVGSAWATAPFAYGPLSLYLSMFAVHVGRNIIGALAVYKLIIALFCLLFVETVSRIPGTGGGRYNLLALVTCAPVLWLQCAGQSHNDVASAALLAVGILLLLRHRPVAGILFAVLAGAFKYSAFLAIPAMIAAVWVTERPLRERIWTLLASALVTLATLSLLFLSIGSDSRAILFQTEFLSSKKPSKSIVDTVAEAIIVSSVLWERGLPASGERNDVYRSHEERKTAIWRVAVPLMYLFSALLAFLVLRRTRRDPGAFFAAAAKIAAIIICFASPVFQPWYFAAFLPLFAFLKDRGWIAWSAIILCYGNLMNIMHVIDRESAWYLAVPPFFIITTGILFFAYFQQRFLAPGTEDDSR